MSFHICFFFFFSNENLISLPTFLPILTHFNTNSLEWKIINSKDILVLYYIYFPKILWYIMIFFTGVQYSKITIIIKWWVIFLFLKPNTGIYKLIKEEGKAMPLLQSKRDAIAREWARELFDHVERKKITKTERNHQTLNKYIKVRQKKLAIIMLSNCSYDYLKKKERRIEHFSII